MTSFRHSVLANREFFILSILAIVCLMLLDPYEMPIWRDRAYLMYMSQVVSRGQDLYESTTFGYTPLAPLVAGHFTKMLIWIGCPYTSVQIIRTLGMLLYVVTVMAFYSFARRFFRKSNQAFLATVIFLCFTGLQVLSVTNFEPKMLGMLFELLLISSLSNRRWFESGLFLSLSAMCWQPYAINGLLLFITLIMAKENLYKNMLLASVGSLLGIFPCVAYLFITNDWNFFWDQAIVRKVQLEGGSLFEYAFIWPFKGFASMFFSELLYLGMFVGGVILILNHLMKLRSIDSVSIKLNINESTMYNLIAGLLLWSVWNSMEFQGFPDMIPIIPFLIILASIFLSYLIGIIRVRFWRYAVLGMVTFYGVSDLLTFECNFKYSDQQSWVSELFRKHGELFVINFEEAYVLTERPMPMKFMRFAKYEDYLIDQYAEDGCVLVASKFEADKYGAIVAEEGTSSLNNIGECAKSIINQFSADDSYQKVHVQKPPRNLFTSEQSTSEYRIYLTKFNRQSISEGNLRLQ